MTELIADHDELEQAGEFARIVVQGRTAITRARIGASILTVLAWSTVVAGALAAAGILFALAGLAGVSATRLDLAIFESLDYDDDA